MAMNESIPKFPSAERPALPGPAAGGESEGMGLSDVVRILKQRLLMILVTTIGLYGLVALVTFGTLYFFPAYTSEAIFEMLPPEQNDYIKTPLQISPEVIEQMLQTESRKLKQPDVLWEVLGEPEVKKTDYFAWYDRDVAKASLGLQKDLVCAPVPDSRLIRLALSAKKKSEALLIVSKIANFYQNKSERTSKGERSDQLQAINNQLASITKELESKRAQLAALRQTADLSRLETERGQHEDNINYLTNHLSDLESQIASLEAQENSLPKNPEDLPLTAEHKLVIDTDPILRYYTAQVEGIDVQMRALASKLGEKHRDMVQLNQQRDEYRSKEMIRREELADQVRTRQMESIHQSLQEMRAIQTKVAEHLDEAQAQERDLDRKMQQHKMLEADTEALNKQRETLMEQKSRAEFIVADTTQQRLRLVQAPKEAVKPSRPDLLVWLVGGAFLAVAGAVGLAFMREMTDTAVRTPSDITRFVHLPLLGTVPRLDDEESEVSRMELVVREAPTSLVAESFRKIRTNLLFSGPPESLKSLLVTSAGAEDGKTSIAVNLALALAATNRRVLLVDANFRRPALRGLFAQIKSEGLSNILIGRGQFEQLVCGTDVPNLFILSSGPMPPNGAELLGSPQMRDLITEASTRYDHVIFDGPPALLVSDASVLAMQVLGVITVVPAEEVSRGELKRLRDQLEMIGARIVGAVLNGVRARAGGYFKNQYREFYEYTTEEAGPTELPPPPSDTTT